MNIWRPSITPSAWGILQLQSCLKFSIAFAVSNCEIGNFINLEDNLNISVQNSRVIVTTVDFPTDGKATATRFSMRIAFLNWVSCFHKRGRQDQPASQSSICSLENQISTEAENYYNDDSPT